MSLFAIFAGLKWNRVERGLAPVIQVLLVYGVYRLGMQYALDLPDPARYINLDIATTQTRVMDAILLLAVALFALGTYLRTRHPNSLL